MQNTPSNRIYFKVFIFNKAGEVLLAEHKNIWEPIGGEYNSPLAMEEVVRALAATTHCTISDIRLRGLFSVYMGQGKQPMVFHYYTAQHETGEIKPPEDCSAAKWTPIDQAIEIIGFEEMTTILKSITDADDLIGGAYRIQKDQQSGKRSFEQLVDFHKLH